MYKWIFFIIIKFTLLFKFITKVQGNINYFIY